MQNVESSRGRVGFEWRIPSGGTEPGRLCHFECDLLLRRGFGGQGDGRGPQKIHWASSGNSALEWMSLTSSWSSSRSSRRVTSSAALPGDSRDGHGGKPGHFGGGGLDAFGLDGLVDGFEMAGIGQDFVALRVGLEIFGAGFQGGFHEGVFLGRLAGDDDLALSYERGGVTEPAVAMEPPFLVSRLRISAAVRLRLSVLSSIRMATPCGP